MKKRKRYLIAALLLIAGVAVIVCWDALVMYLAPKTVLTKAITQAFTALDQRSQDSPLRLLARGYDENGQNKTQIVLEMPSTGEEGTTAFHMVVQSALENNQILAEGSVISGGMPLGVSLYLDRDFAALKSENLLNSWYGITYDTFGEDLRSFKLIGLLVPDATISEMESKLMAVKTFMNRSYTIPKMPDYSQEDICKAMLEVLTLRSHVSREMISLNGITLDCWKISYNAAGQQVSEAVGYVLDGVKDGDGVIKASFWLCDKTLVKAQLSGTAGQDAAEFELLLGMDAAQDDLSFSAEKRENGEETSLSMTMKNKQVGKTSTETFRFGTTVISYDWDPASGQMNLTLPNREPISLYLSAAGNGVTVQTEDFMELMGLKSKKDVACTMTIQKGTAGQAPSYKNLDQWSWEDLLLIFYKLWKPQSE